MSKLELKIELHKYFFGMGMSMCLWHIFETSGINSVDEEGHPVISI